MNDFVYLVITIAFFGLTVGMAYLFEQLRKEKK